MNYNTRASDSPVLHWQTLSPMPFKVSKHTLYAVPLTVQHRPNKVLKLRTEFKGDKICLPSGFGWSYSGHWA